MGFSDLKGFKKPVSFGRPIKGDSGTEGDDVMAALLIDNNEEDDDIDCPEEEEVDVKLLLAETEEALAGGSGAI